MKAIVCHRYGSPDVLHLQEVDRPVVGDDQVMVRVCAASVNPSDWHLLGADPFFVRLMRCGLLRPRFRILGADIAGRVESVGSKVTRFRAGDEVFGGESAVGAGYGGGFAEYACVNQSRLVLKPSGLSFEEAAALPVAGLAALQALRDEATVQPGHRVLINGASGGVGTFAVQIARWAGAEVTGVCSSRNLDMVRSIGADHVIDYTRQDFTRNGHQYDVIVDAAAYRSIADYRRSLAPAGIYVMVGGSTARMFQALWRGFWAAVNSDRKMVVMMSKPSREDLLFLKQLVEIGGIMPVVDRRYRLEQVPDAIRYVESGHARGKVVVVV